MPRLITKYLLLNAGIWAAICDNQWREKTRGLCWVGLHVIHKVCEMVSMLSCSLIKERDWKDEIFFKLVTLWRTAVNWDDWNFTC
jgi:hypothetical protein